MVPADFVSFFATSAQVAASLVGLLFVAVSLAPERSILRSAPVERRAVAGSTFTALLNALFISLAALVPRGHFGLTVLLVSAASLISTLGLSGSLLRHWLGWLPVLRRVFLFGSAVVIYGIELSQGMQLIQDAAYSNGVGDLPQLLLVVYALATVRAWELLGAQSFSLRGWLSPLRGLEDPIDAAAHGAGAPSQTGQGHAADDH